MILQLRIDERLIHGQIAAAWGRALPISSIVCASDIAVNDPLRTKMLLMAAPPQLKTRVKSVEDVIKLLSDPRADAMKILLITDCPESALRLVEKLTITEVNVANYHTKDADKIKITATCEVNKDDLGILKNLASKDIDIYTQMIPTTDKKDFRKLMENL